MIEQYTDIIAWQKSIDFVDCVYSAIKKIPSSEDFAIKSQMRRAAVSIPSNIAEGFGRNSNAEFSRFLKISKGSLYELETQIIICYRQKYFSEDLYMSLIDKSKELSKIISGLINSVEKTK